MTVGYNIVKTFGILILILNINPLESCFTHCDTTDPIDNDHNFVGSGNVCIECKGLVRSLQYLDFYINQTDVKSFNILQINELIIESFGEFVITYGNEKYSFSKSKVDQKFDVLKIKDNLIGFHIQLVPKRPDPSVGAKPVERFKLDFNYKNLPFVVTEETIDADNAVDKTLSFNYEPNCVHTWILNRTRPKSYGILISVTELDLDTDSGDYMIIGQTRVVGGSHSRSLILTDSRRVPKSIYFDSDEAYIQVVTHASDMSGHRLTLSYIPLNKTYELNEDEDILDSLRPKALHICVQHRCEDTEYYRTLRSVMASYLNGHIFDGTLQLKTLITNESVAIFDKEDRSANSGQYCSAQLAITRHYDQRFTEFDKSVLRNILFGSGHELVIGGQAVNDCHPEGIQIREIYEIVVYFLLPILCVLLILWCLTRRHGVSNEAFEKLKIMSATNGTADPVSATYGSDENSVNTRLTVSNVQKLDSDNEFALKEYKSNNSKHEWIESRPQKARETLDRRTSYSDDLDVIQIKGYSKKRASILDNAFTSQPLYAKTGKGRTLSTDKNTNINKSI